MKKALLLAAGAAILMTGSADARSSLTSKSAQSLSFGKVKAEDCDYLATWGDGVCTISYVCFAPGGGIPISYDTMEEFNSTSDECFERSKTLRSQTRSLSPF